MPGTAKVAISLPKPLLARVDREAARCSRSRSAVVREALETVFDDPAADPVVTRAARIYAQIDEESRRMSEAFLRIAAPPPPHRATPKRTKPR